MVNIFGQYEIEGGRIYLNTWSIYGREELLRVSVTWSIFGRLELLSYLVNIWETGVTQLLGQYMRGRSYSVTWAICRREELLSYLVNI